MHKEMGLRGIVPARGPSFKGGQKAVKSPRSGLVFVNEMPSCGFVSAPIAGAYSLYLSRQKQQYCSY